MFFSWLTIFLLINCNEILISLIFTWFAEAMTPDFTWNSIKMFEMQQVANVPYMGQSKLDSKGFRSTANGLSPNETISILGLDHRQASITGLCRSVIRSRALTRNETFDRGPEHFLLKSLLAALLLEFAPTFQSTRNRTNILETLLMEQSMVCFRVH